ncbi:MAG TPA: hypothetical protein VGG48_01815 [Rhizomicrobium sp.]|jgi:hypothetical protein
MSGDQTAVALAMAATRDEIDEEAEQLDLLGLPEAGSPATLVQLQTQDAAKKVGRPLNSRNKRTIARAEYLLGRYGSPLEVLAQMATARVDELCLQLGCSKLEAWQEKRLAAIAMLPYVHQKMPVSVDITNTKAVHLAIYVEPPPSGETPDDGDVFTLTGAIVDRAPDAD